MSEFEGFTSKDEEAGTSGETPESQTTGAIPAPAIIVPPAIVVPKLTRREAARTRSGSCPMYPPRGTVCKTCGKVHAL